MQKTKQKFTNPSTDQSRQNEKQNSTSLSKFHS